MDQVSRIAACIRFPICLANSEQRTNDRNPSKRFCALVAFIYCTIFCVPGAFARPEVHPFLSSKFIIQVGYYYPNQDLDLRVDGSLGVENIEFDFDEQLGFSQKDDVFTMEMAWRLGEKWSLRMQHFQENRRSSVVLETDIECGDRVLTAGECALR